VSTFSLTNLNANEFAKDQTLDADRFNEDVASPSGSTNQSSLDGINGWLEAENMKAERVTDEMVQRGSLVRAKMVGARRVIEWGRDSLSSTGATQSAATKTAIPGACASVNSPVQMGLFIISWAVLYSTNDNDAQAVLYYSQKRATGTWTEVAAHHRQVLQDGVADENHSTHRRWAGSRVIALPATGRWDFAIRMQKRAGAAEAKSALFTDWRYMLVVQIK